MASGWRRLQLLARPRLPEALPTRLHRRRIYVLPTRFSAFMAAVLVAMLLGALNYNNNPALLLALLLAAASVASAIAAHLQLQLGDARAWLDLAAQGRGEAELDIPATRRGWLDLECIRLSSTQPLGLVRAWSWV
ncbi:MAG: hypothetical protein GAK31_02759 [Stenotrophomonas maltophilia]|uniref:DUF58 domain-containing protein n=1 Tax=Stenotrophomonas maltophilia TaxID=40324 RepID=A0A7V8JKP5_STEMA|nr:MAG: hypothetical protein GAK31_02759 [Stenotrophomonas maltophilia]